MILLLVASPSLAWSCTVPTDEPLPLGSDAASCGSCHQEHYAQWRTSPHARASESPLLEAMLPEVEREWGLTARARCESCHQPAHDPLDDGIGCISCHAATGNHAERDGQLVVDPSRGIAGPLGTSDSTPAHRTRASELLTSPSLCGTCHELTGPNIVAEPTLTEYRASPAAQAGTTCADCHLPDETPRAWTDHSPSVRETSSHRFVGFDPPWGAGEEEAAAAAERTRALLASALELRIEPADGGVNVVLRNVGAGHSVPTGATFLRDLWVDVLVGGELRPRVIALGDQPMHGEMQVPLLTRADHVDTGSLRAGDERTVFVEAEGEVSAWLRGRAVRSSVLSALGLEHLEPQVPVHEIHEARGGAR